jgi:hypothetical protein
MSKKTTKVSSKKVLSECKAAFKKICDANGLDKDFFDQAFEAFENKVDIILNPQVDVKKQDDKKSKDYIVSTGAQNTLNGGVYVHQKGASQKADAASGRAM